MARIALVDDDRNIVESLSVFLLSEGFEVDTYHDGLTALAEIERKPPDLAILDIKMPRMDGMELLKRLRRGSDIPVIFLTSKDEEVDEYEGLTIGADDYVRKPCSNRLLAQRVKAVLRRARGEAGGNGKTLHRGPLALDIERYVCTWHGQSLRLTVTEFQILQSLAQRPGHVKSRDQLIDAAYDNEVYVDDRTIDSHIKRIRKKFRDRDRDFDGIETLYGVGYRYKET